MTSAERDRCAANARPAHCVSCGMAADPLFNPIGPSGRHASASYCVGVLKEEVAQLRAELERERRGVRA